MVAQRRLQAGAQGHLRVEGAVGVLEDELHRPAQRLELLALGARDVAAVELDVARGGLHRPQDRPRQRALAAAGLTYEAEYLTLADRQGHPVDRVNRLALPAG